MSVTGTSFRSKTECFVLQCVAENEKQLQNEHQNSTRDAKSKSETSGKKMSKKTVVAAILLILGFSGAIAYIGNRYHQEQKYCYTKQCKRSEKKFLESVNFDVKPCDNFYEFVCGNWKNHHPIPDDAHNVDAFYELQQRTTNEIANFLKHKNSKMEPEAVHSARALFKSCLRAEKLNKTNRFEQIADVLIDVNLPPVPSFTETSENFSWPLTAVLSKKLYNHNFFFEFTTTNDPKNHSIYRLSIVKPSSINPLSVNRISQKKVNSENQCYSYSRNESYYQNENETEYFMFDKEELLKDEHYTLPKSILTYIYKEYGLQWTDEIEDEFYEMVNPFFLTFERDVQILVEKKTNKSPNLPEYITIDELQELTDLISECHDKSPIIYWKSFFHWMFEDIPDVELDFEDRDREIVLMDREYLIEIMKLIASTPPYVIEFYMWWKTVSGILPFTNSILNEIYNEITENEKPRNEYCAEITNEILGFAAAHFIIYDKTVNENMKRISEMVESIQQAFLDEMKNVKWMDEETRKKALQKLGAMKKRIGYPAWMNNTKDYDEYYAGIVMDEDDFFSNVVRYHRGNLESMLNGLHVFETEPTDGWDSKPLEVNAYFNIDENTMIIPAGMFPYPFYHLGLESLNYGAIGVVIGHEMIHGFDNTGKEYDKDGHLNPWWTNETRMEYQDRATCFINHYSQFNFSEIENAVNTTSLSGIQTLDENIADNGGLRIAFYAYKDFVAKNGPEKRLPTLKEYTNEQMFFLSFAHTWCEHSTSEWLEETLASDEHSPHFVRVLATLMNSKEFAKAWECPKGSPMNPEKHKCEMW